MIVVKLIIFMSVKLLFSERNCKIMKKLFAKKTDPMKKAMEVANTSSAKTIDPYGMYTGVPKDPTEKPVQDADDL